MKKRRSDKKQLNYSDVVVPLRVDHRLGGEGKIHLQRRSRLTTSSALVLIVVVVVLLANIIRPVVEGA